MHEINKYKVPETTQPVTSHFAGHKRAASDHQCKRALWQGSGTFSCSGKVTQLIISLTLVKLYSFSHVCTSHNGLELCPADQNKPKPQPLQLLLKGGGGRHMALSFLRNMTW